ncbi:MAG: glycohydrolase toxin TNT-related protein [Kutzneria sp.]|nr:glycohydrolase toxin TNT-related protein [Kutzneria sp.]
MGITLPAELGDVAAAVAVPLPQADETEMHAAAHAWRRAAAKLTTLAKDADIAAGRALAAMTGRAADAARRHWDAFVLAENGHVTTAVRGCLAAADRLELAAEKIAAAKVEIIAKLVAYARARDAATAAADTHPAARAALATMLAGTRADITSILADLAEAVRFGARPVSPSSRGDQQATREQGVAGEQDVENRPDTLPDGLLGLASGLPEVDQLVAVPPDTGQPGTDPAAAGARQQQGQGETGSSTDTQDAAAPVGPVVVTGPTGPVSRHTVIAARQAAGVSVASTGPGADPPTGPIRLPGPASLSGGEFTDPAAAPVWSDPNPPTGPISPAPVTVAQGAGNSTELAQPALGGQFFGAKSLGGQFGPVPGGAAPERLPAPAPYPGGFPRDGYTDASVPVQPVPGQPGGIAPVAPRTTTAPAPSGPNHPAVPAIGDGQTGQTGQPVSERHPGPAVRETDSPTFVVAYLFPIGHLPVPSDRPVRQLPPPERELDYAPGLRFPPWDHPESALVGAVGPASDRTRVELPEPYPAEHGDVGALAVNHDPLGGADERDWNRRFLVRVGGSSGSAEYSWPPAEPFAEGGEAPGRAVVLDIGTVIDRFGDVWGRVFASAGTPFPHRSLPPSYLAAGYRRYRVIGRLPVWRTTSAPWFGQPGGGIRYRATHAVADLIALGFLEALP